MKRQARDRTDAYRPEPVKRIELDGSRPAVRLVLICLFLAIGFTAIGLGVNSFLRSENGWTEIEPASAELNCSGDFIFLYNLGGKGLSATAEKKQLTLIYSSACEEAVDIFYISADSEENTEGAAGIKELNSNPNKTLQVHPALYTAFETVQKTGSRYPYYAPVFEQYNTLFNCANDEEAANFRPEQNPELAEYFKEVCAFASDEDSVNVVLLGDNILRLEVSAEYLAFAEENGIDVYVSFYALTNAFVADFLAERITEKDFTEGVISSYDGFTRCFCTSGEAMSLNVFSLENGDAVITDRLDYSSPMNLAYLKTFPAAASKEYYWYRTSDGEYITPFVDAETGFYAPLLQQAIKKDPQKTCGELALEAYDEITGG